MSYRGDIVLESSIDVKFTTVDDTGAPATLSGTPVVSAYIDNSTTQITAGITLSVDFDGVTGLNNVRVAATGANGYTTGTNVDLVITTGTVDSVSVVGYVVGSFSISHRSSVAPLSDIESSLVIIKSDLVLTTSDTAAIESELIVVHSETTVIQSDTTVLEPAVSDVESSLVIIKSDLVVIDDLASDIHSSLVIARSDLLQVYSDTTHIHSDTAVIEAAGGALTATQASQLARIQSDVIIVGSDLLQVYSDTTILVPAASDIESSIVIIRSDLLQVYSDTTVIEAGGGSLTATQASQLARIQSDTIIVGSDLLQVYSDTTILTAGVNVTQISGDTTAADTLEVLLDAQKHGTLSGTHSDTTADLGTNAPTEDISGQTLWFPDHGGLTRIVDSYNDSTGVATFESIGVTLANGNIWILIPSAPGGADSTAMDTALSDIESSIVIIKSDLLQVYSDTTILVPGVSDIESSLVIVKSDLIVLDDAVSDVESSIVIIRSDLLQVYSDTTVMEAGGGSLTATQASQLARIQSDTIIVQSDLLQVYSDTTLLVPGVSDVHSSLVITRSDLLQVYSDTTILEVSVSDVESSLVIVKSDLVVLDDAVSDVESSLVIIKSDLVITTSDTTAIESNLILVHSETTVIQSDVALFEASHAEPTGVPSATASPLTKLGVIYMALRNRVTITGTKKTFYDDSNSPEWEQDLSDNGTTYDQSEANAV